MYIRLNEQEIIDSVCVDAAGYFHVNPEDIDVREIKALDNGDIVAYANVIGGGRFYEDFDLNDIMNGIVGFLVDFHDFDPEVIVVRAVSYKRNEGFFAEVTVNE